MVEYEQRVHAFVPGTRFFILAIQPDGQKFAMETGRDTEVWINTELVGYEETEFFGVPRTLNRGRAKTTVELTGSFIRGQAWKPGDDVTVTQELTT